MSYCRFQNTLSDLRDCQAALEDLFMGCGDPLSRDEQAAAVELVEVARQVVALVAEEAGVDELPIHDIDRDTLRDAIRAAQPGS